MSLRAPFVRPVLMTEYLFTAIEERNLPRLSQIFLNSKANPNCRNADGKPLIVYAAEQGFAQGMAKILGQPGANPNLKDRNGQAALHVTARKGDLVGTKILVEGGGIKNIRDSGYYSPLHHAVKEGRTEVVNYLVNDPEGKHKNTGSVNIDAVANDRTTPLLQACYNSNLPLVKMLIEAGARTNWRDSDGYTAKSIAVFKGWDKQIGAELPMDPFTSEFIKRKVLAHCNGIGSKSEIDKTLFSLEGAYSPYMHQMMHKQLQLYFQTSQGSLLDGHKQAILEAFELSGPNIPAQDVVDRIQEGRLAILQAGWKCHAIDLVFFGDYMAICNRGEGVPEGYKTIEVVKIDRKLVSKDIINQIRSQKNMDCSHASSYFYFDLHAKLAGAGLTSAIKDDLCRKISDYAPKPIKQGTCTFAAAKAAARASMMLVTLTHFEKSRYNFRAFLCREDSKMASILGRLDALKQYLHSHFHEAHPDGKKPLDESLVRRCFFKTTKHVNTTRGAIRDLFESRIKELKRDYPRVFIRKPPGF